MTKQLEQTEPYFIAIDPSINSLGWSIQSKEKLLCHGTCKAPKKWKEEENAERLAGMLGLVQEAIFIDHKEDIEGVYIVGMLIEQPQQWGAYKSVASQHQKDGGGILLLHLMVGVLLGYFIGFGLNVELIRVSEWKGNLKKHHTQKRIKDYYGESLTWANDDESDAIGLGLWGIEKRLPRWIEAIEQQNQKEILN